MSMTYKEMADIFGVEERNRDKRGSGGSTHYYTLPFGATELKDLIRYKKMPHGIGEAFAALYRLNDNGERLRNLKKALFYIQDEIDFMENQDD
jgi:hypothetical protein